MSEVLYPLGDGVGSVALIDHMGNDLSVVNAARVSFGAYSEWAYTVTDGDGKVIDTDVDEQRANQLVMLYSPEDGPHAHKVRHLSPRDRKLIRSLLRDGHGSVLEQNALTFRVKAPIFVVRQWLRHRLASPNEVSARYVEVKEEFYIPDQFRQQAKSNRQASVKAADEFPHERARTLYLEACQSSFSTYQMLLSLGVTREQARGVLPLTTYTEFLWTVNLRALLHFLDLREDTHAQWEMQQFAHALRALAAPLFTGVFEAYAEMREAQHD